MNKGRIDWNIYDISMCKVNTKNCFRHVFNLADSFEFKENSECAAFVFTDIHYILADLNMSSMECRRIIVQLVGIVLVAKPNGETLMARINSLLGNNAKSAESVVCKLRRTLRELFDKPETLGKFKQIFGLQYTADTCSPKAFLDQLAIAYEIAFLSQHKLYADARIEK